MQEVVSTLSDLCNKTAFCDKPDSVLEGLLWLFYFLLFLPLKSHAFLLFEICVIKDLSLIIDSLNRSVRDG
jgi:hypothetical protein